MEAQMAMAAALEAMQALVGVVVEAKEEHLEVGILLHHGESLLKVKEQDQIKRRID